jgi:hypothetical protein
MADESNPSNPRGGRPSGGRDGGGRNGGGRDSGGFRIRLSDNEMQAARALQEAFGLRSTVAVLGFSLRTLAQQLEQGQLDELIAQQRAQGGGRPPGPREGGRGEGGRGEGGRGESGERRRAPRVDPFARPSRPAAPAAEDPAPEEAAPEESPPEEGASASMALGDHGAAEELVPEEAAAEAPAPEASPASEAEPDDGTGL